jgi:hypothetical protein
MIRAKIIATLSIVTVFAIVASANFYTLAGHLLSYQEASRLRKAGADANFANPPAQVETFPGGQLSSVWKYMLLYGAGEIGQPPKFHSTEVILPPDGGELVIAQHFDPDFDAKKDAGFGTPDAGKQYNNAAIVGFDGYQPTPSEDIILECGMYTSPDFYGSSGCILEQSGTLQVNGHFKDGKFNSFGVSMIGKNSTLQGYSGPVADLVINWWPNTVLPLAGTDMTLPHTYSIRLAWVNDHLWDGTIFVDGQLLAEVPMPPLGPLEVQIWSDNYVLRSPNRWLVPTVGYGNGEQSTTFTRVSVRAEKK